MASNCCKDCLPMVLNYHNKLQALREQLQFSRMENSKREFAAQLRELAPKPPLSSRTIDESDRVMSPTPDYLETLKRAPLCKKDSPQRSRSVLRESNNTSLTKGSPSRKIDLFTSVTQEEVANLTNDAILQSSQESSMMSPLKESDLLTSNQGSSTNILKLIRTSASSPLKPRLFGNRSSVLAIPDVLTLDELTIETSQPLRTPAADTSLSFRKSSPQKSSYYKWDKVYQLPVVERDSKYYTTDLKQELKLGELTLARTSITPSGKPSMGFEVYTHERISTPGANAILRVEWSGQGTMKDEETFIYNVVTPVGVVM